MENIIKKLEDLEKESRHLEPGLLQRKELEAQVLQYGNAFLDDLENKKAFVVSEERGKGLYDFPVSEDGRSIQELIELITKYVDNPGLNPASGGHLAYIPGGGVYPSALGDYLAAISNRYAGIFFASPGAVRMENMLLNWMRDIFELPPSTLGNLTSGGSIANLIAIVTARDEKKIHAEKVRNAVIYMTGQAHHCLDKSIRIAGLSHSVIRRIPMDDSFSMDAEALSGQMEADRKNNLNPFLIIASVGTTDTGAIDPVGALAQLRDENDCWLHLDAAYGGFFILSQTGKPMIKNLNRADSLVIDPHKGLFLPYGIGAVLVPNGDALRRSHYYEASYMQDAARETEEVSPADTSPELTRHFRGLRMWLPIQLFGLKPFRAALDEKIWLCRYFYKQVAEIPNIEVGPFPKLSVMIFRYVPESGDVNAFNEALITQVRKDGRVFLSSTTIDGRFYIRLAVLSFRTHKSTIDICLQILKEKIEYLNSTL